VKWSWLISLALFPLVLVTRAPEIRRSRGDTTDPYLLRVDSIVDNYWHRVDSLVKTQGLGKPYSDHEMGLGQNTGGTDSLGDDSPGN
jgi:hypothetical protein